MCKPKTLNYVRHGLFDLMGLRFVCGQENFFWTAYRSDFFMYSKCKKNFFGKLIISIDQTVDQNMFFTPDAYFLTLTIHKKI